MKGHEKRFIAAGAMRSRVAYTVGVVATVICRRWAIGYGTTRDGHRNISLPGADRVFCIRIEAISTYITLIMI